MAEAETEVPEGEEFDEVVSPTLPPEFAGEHTEPGVEGEEASSEGGSERGKGGGAGSSNVASTEGSSSRIHALSYRRNQICRVMRVDRSMAFTPRLVYSEKWMRILLGRN